MRPMVAVQSSQVHSRCWRHWNWAPLPIYIRQGELWTVFCRQSLPSSGAQSSKMSPPLQGIPNKKFNDSAFLQVGGYEFINSGGTDEHALKAAVAKGPVIVSVDSTGWFQYKGGLFEDCASSNGTHTNHAVLVTGYGTLRHRFWVLDYWIIKNSWGSDWGWRGYILLPRNHGSQCNIASWPLIPTPP